MSLETNETLRQDPAVIEAFGDVLDRYPNHEIMRTGGIVRWKPKKITLHLRDLLKEGQISMDKLWSGYSRGDIPVEEMAQFYREIGYTLGGFMELFEIPLGLELKK